MDATFTHDPRDARIEYLDAQVAELVHSLKSISAMTIDYSMGNPDERLDRIGEIVDLTLYEDEPEWLRRVDVANARIAELEAALCEIRERIEKHIDRLSVQDVLIMRVVDAVLPRPPEGDMTMTVEDLKL